jgi:anti-sigma factor RsiW
MSTACEFYVDALGDFVVGRLDPERQLRVERHVANCPNCAATLEAARAVRAAAAPVPAGLEARIQRAVREAVREDRARGMAGEDRTRGGAAVIGSPRRVPAERGTRWRPWAVPLAAAAALALVWVGVGEFGGGPTGAETELIGEADVAPYGAWPATDGRIAGDPLLSELSEEQLERLLEEMGS